MNQDKASGTATDIVYRIDREGRLVELSPNWDEFALANDGALVVESRVRGTALLDHVAAPALRELLTRLIDGVRKTREDVELPFRCDSPETIREMRLRITAEPDGSVKFRSTLERVAPREIPVRLLDAGQPRSEELIRICSWCNRGAVGADWLELDDAIRANELFEREPVPAISHGLCEPCAAKLSAGL